MPPRAAEWDAIRANHGLRAPAMGEMLSQSWEFLDFVFLDRAQHTAGRNLLESVQLGDIPGVGMVMIDGIVRLARSLDIGVVAEGVETQAQLDFLRDHEVVLTFDDGPWPGNTPAVLKALADECTTGIFFPIGKHATYHPEILRQVYAAGHTVGSHTWSHENLNNKKLTEDQKKDEIERGLAAVKWALETSPSPFFRFPALQHPPEMVTYLGNRNIAIFSCDLDSFDFKSKNSQQVVDTVMKKLAKLGKGIILMHDFQKHTAEALPTLLTQLKAGGFKVVAMRAKFPATVLPQYEQDLAKDVKLPTVSSRPVNSVVTTVDQ